MYAGESRALSFLIGSSVSRLAWIVGDSSNDIVIVALARLVPPVSSDFSLLWSLLVPVICLMRHATLVASLFCPVVSFGFSMVFDLAFRFILVTCCFMALYVIWFSHGQVNEDSGFDAQLRVHMPFTGVQLFALDMEMILFSSHGMQFCPPV